MTNPTSNFNWQMPTSSDLVTNLPADFETFGQAVDSDFADLLGGTTGQVLSKASATDLDFAWVTTDDANAIQNAIVNAKGDIIGASANDVPAITSVGANGETLIADSSTSTGLRWQVPVNVNPILNSSFQIWQRGTSVACSSTAYSADRWQAYRGSGATVSRQVTNDSTNLPFIQYCARVQRDLGNTSTDPIQLAQSMETVNSIPFVGKTVTLSFYARKGADYSAGSSVLAYRLNYGTGTDQNVITSYTGNVSAIMNNAILTTTWQRFSASVAIPTSATEIGFRFLSNPTGTAGAADYFEVTGVQLEVGSVATPYKSNQPTLATELAACQRYYYRFTGDGAFQNYGFGMAQIATSARIWVVNPVTMRVKPTSLDYANLTLSQIDAAYPVTALTIQTDTSGKNGVSLSATVASGLTTYRSYFLYNDNNTAGYVGLSAEL